jgi:hypothetical protein
MRKTYLEIGLNQFMLTTEVITKLNRKKMLGKEITRDLITKTVVELKKDISEDYGEEITFAGFHTILTQAEDHFKIMGDLK